MGAIWLAHLPWWIEEAGLDVDTWPGWEVRSRSSGGYDAIHAIGVHHTAGGGSLDSNSRYCWDNASARPVGAILLAPDGCVRVGAAGATNTQGKGGPYTTSKGTTPKDAGNRYWVSIEAINRGDGTPWPEVQQEAYVRLCRVLCQKLGLDPRSDVLAHFEWAPNRKVDPAGQSKYASGSAMWSMGAFRSDVVPPPPPPPPPGDDMASINAIRLRVQDKTGKLYKDQIFGLTIANPDQLAQLGIDDDPLYTAKINATRAQIEAELGFPLKD